jgi:hypothetical protein
MTVETCVCCSIISEIHTYKSNQTSKQQSPSYMHRTSYAL